MSILVSYISLEQSFTRAFSPDGSALGFSTSKAVELFTTTSFLFSLGIAIILVVAAVMFLWAGIQRMTGTPRGINKSKEIINRTTLGVVGVLGLFAFIYIFNSDLLTGEVGLRGFRVGAVPTQQTSQTNPTSGGNTVGGGSSSASCADTKTVISNLTSQSGVCGNTQCTALSGCNYQQYLPIIESKAKEAGIQPSIVIALMCRESKANPNAQHKNESDGSYDCGLMQINQKNACDAASLDPATNITKGIATIKQKINIANQVYQNIPPLLGAFASYNCCANGTIPNSTSADCNQASGFPYPIPKWACPINPGDSKTNMCFVKNYACDVYACVQQLDS